MSDIKKEIGGYFILGFSNASTITGIMLTVNGLETHDDAVLASGLALLLFGLCINTIQHMVFSNKLAEAEDTILHLEQTRELLHSQLSGVSDENRPRRFRHPRTRQTRTFHRRTPPPRSQ